MRFMAEAKEPDKVKLICGMISARKELFDEVINSLGKAFGPIDLTGEMIPFDLTDYYNDEMGFPLLRRFVAFAELIGPDALVETKIRTNEIEAEFSQRLAGEGKPIRPINLDPGYIAPSKLVLASMKDFSHRIYMGQGVYAEITLMYRKGLWESLPWTFPDYASGRYDHFLTKTRNLLRQK